MFLVTPGTTSPSPIKAPTPEPTTPPSMLPTIASDKPSRSPKKVPSAGPTASPFESPVVATDEPPPDRSGLACIAQFKSSPEHSHLSRPALSSQKLSNFWQYAVGVLARRLGNNCGDRGTSHRAAVAPVPPRRLPSTTPFLRRSSSAPERRPIGCSVPPWRRVRLSAVRRRKSFDRRSNGRVRRRVLDGNAHPNKDVRGLGPLRLAPRGPVADPLFVDAGVPAATTNAPPR